MKKTKVIFRYWFPEDDSKFPWDSWRNRWGNKRMGEKARKQGYGEVIALFPEIPADTGGGQDRGEIRSFLHIGQFSGADYNGIIRTSVPATPAEYKELKKELEKIYGYRLKVYQKQTVEMRRNRDKAERGE